jgi:predicted permease
MGTLIRDTIYASRVLLKHPAFTVVAVLALALGIGANTTIFSMVNALLLRSTPGVTEPLRLAQVGRTNNGEGFDTLSYLNYIDLRDQNTVFSGLAVQNRTQFHVSTGAEPIRVAGQLVSGNYFDVLGMKPALGRMLTSDDDRVAGEGSVVVISSGLWKRRFGGDHSIIGKEISLNAHRYTVVGVAPPGFIGTDIGDPVELWVPVTMYRQGDPMASEIPEDFLKSRGVVWLTAFGRLKQGVTIEQARAEVSRIASNLEHSYPETNKNTGMSIAQGVGLDPQSRSEIQAFTGMLMSVVGLVLLIACANVANLLLARATSRQKEIGIRLALGASRGRIIRQLLTESMLLALVSGAAGLFLALWLNDLLLKIVPGDFLGFVLDLDLGLDARVLAFTLGLSLVTGIVFGLAPALQASKPDLVPVLKDSGAAAGRGAGQARLRSALVVAQIALSLVLMITAGLFVRTLRNTRNINPGFDPQHVLSARIDVGRQNYSKQQGQLFFQQLIERLESTPGVQSASLSITTPLGGGAWGTGIRTEWQPAASPDVGVDFNSIAPRYFETMTMPLVRGRDFTWQDTAESAPVVIINETLARRLWPDEDPIGKRLTTGGPPNANPLREVIGVARDAKYRTLFESPRREMFLPILQNYHSEASLQVRAAGNPAQLISSVQHEVSSMDRNLPVFKVKTMSEQLDSSLTPQLLAAKLIGTLGALALLLAAVGIYGVMSYAVAQRTHEIGVRMALGAQASDVLKLVVGRGLKLTLIGVGIGLAGAYALTRAIESFLYGIGPTDPVTFVGISLLLTGVALGACLAPARRAIKVDPMVALRYE